MSDTVIKDFVTKTEDNPQIQELKDVIQFYKQQRSKYLKYKFFYDTLQDCIRNVNSLDDELKVKIQRILLSSSCVEVIPLANENLINQASGHLLGIMEFGDTELSYNESEKLNKVFATTLQEKYNKMYQEFTKITHLNIHEVSTKLSQHDSLDCDLDVEDLVLFDYKKKLDEQQNQYLKNVLKEQEILDNLAKLRFESLPKMCNEKVSEFQVKSNMNALRTKIVQEKTRVDIFLETSKSLHAYKEVIKDLKKQQEQCQHEIEYLKNLKEKYKHVACKQFTDILKSYVQYKMSLEKKKLIYESLKS